MIGALFKAIAYSKAPRTTFSVLHPGSAVRLRKFKWDMRHAYAPRVTALGAAALALPIGLWLGRRRNGGNQVNWQPADVAGHRPEPRTREMPDSAGAAD